MNLTTLREFQKEFNSALEISIDKNYLIENELREINNFLNFSSAPNKKRKGLFKTPKANQTSVFKLVIPNMLGSQFIDAYHSFLKIGDFEPPKFHQDTEESFKVKKEISKQAFEFSEYYKWLIVLQTTPQKVHKKSSLTHKQKLLALHYLGLDTSKYDNTKIAKILSEILELSEDNTRQYLSYLTARKNDVRTKNNLEKVSQLFENQGLDNISNTIKK